MTVITLLTDFGTKDGNVGVMKGVIWQVSPTAKIADLSHTINPQNVLEASFVLNRSAAYFPEGTIHVVVVDPGVGTERRGIAGMLGPYFFVGPDNGVITRFLEQAEGRGWQTEFVNLDQPQFWRQEVSHVFHGRDIFAPAAAHLAEGVSLHNLGGKISDLHRLPTPKPRPGEGSVEGEVIYVDHFGSLVTNIRGPDLPSTAALRVLLKGVEISGLVNTFGERPSGSIIALFSSVGDLIIAVVNGSAADRLGIEVGEKVTVLHS